MNVRLPYVALAAALLALVRWSQAQEPAAGPKPAEAQPAEAEPVAVPAELEERYRRMAAQLKEPLPERDFKVQTVEAQKVPLTRPDPKLLENKSLGELTLVVGGIDPQLPESRAKHLRRIETDSQSMKGYPDELVATLKLGPGYLLHRYGVFGSRGRAENIFGPHFQALAVQCPPESRPAERLVAFLTSAEADRDLELNRSGFAPGSQVEFLKFRIFAPSAEEAELRAEAIAKLYDGGLSRPMQQYLFGEGQKYLASARGQYEELATVLKELQVESEKLAKPSEISGDILSQLKAQKVMVAVELAGLSARVKACDAMLADPKNLPINTLQSISDMKVKAEIERVGIKEKLDQINVFIAEGDARKVASNNRIKLEYRRNQLRQEIRTLEQMATRYAELFELYVPFRVPDNQITVGPIEWTQQ